MVWSFLTEIFNRAFRTLLNLMFHLDQRWNIPLDCGIYFGVATQIASLYLYHCRLPGNDGSDSRTTLGIDSDRFRGR